MASLFSLTTTNIPFSTNFGLKHKHYPKKVVSCKALDGDQNPAGDTTTNPAAKNKEKEETSIMSSSSSSSLLAKFDRRNVLLGLGGYYGASRLISDPLNALAAPVVPDFKNCGPLPSLLNSKPTDCCPPKTTSIKTFKPPRPPCERVRPAAHLVDPDYIDKFSKALKLMKELPDTDPRSFKQQAMVHCAYCEGSYHQLFPMSPKLTYKVHQSWLFFPFHRAYLYFFERILGELIGDPNFAMPFWNWDSPRGMKIPPMYNCEFSPFYDKFRNAKHLPPVFVDLDYSGHDSPTPVEDQIRNNLGVMYGQMVRLSNDPYAFLGQRYVAGQDPDLDPSPAAGLLENTPHNNIHIWTGDPNHEGEDMGKFYSAGKDPIFYAHHSNIDRLWEVWRTLGGKRKNFTDWDWLNAEFFFYDENADLVRVKVENFLDTRSLGYVYEDVEMPWLTFELSNKIPLSIPLAKRDEGMRMGSATALPARLDKTVRVLVPRTRMSRTKREKEEEEEILVIEGIELDKHVFVKFDVLINNFSEPDIGPENAEFASSFVNVPHGGHKEEEEEEKKDQKMKTRMRLSINKLIEDLGADAYEELLVTLVPRTGCENVIIGGIKIEFAS